MFTYRLTIQLHHTDAYGIIFFANQFKFCHDAFQALLEELGFPLPPTRHDVPAMFVIVHAECDYKAPIHVGDKLTIEVFAEKIGTTSLIMGYRFSNQHRVQVGAGRTVHVFIDTTTSAKVPLTERVKKAFTPHLV
jgi:1,4-dihydroxy-2-naphthoyl-CoA hydrolase